MNALPKEITRRDLETKFRELQAEDTSAGLSRWSTRTEEWKDQNLGRPRGEGPAPPPPPRARGCGSDQRDRVAEPSRPQPGIGVGDPRRRARTRRRHARRRADDRDPSG